MGDEYRKNHFVPQFYLRNFGTERSVGMYRLRAQQHIASASIKDQCQKDWLYGRDGRVEASLNGLEGVAAAAIRDIILTGRPPTHGELPHLHLLVFTVFQLGRTPQAGRAMENRVTTFARAVMRELADVPPHLKEHLDMVRLRNSAPELVAMREHSTLAPMLVDLPMCVLVAPAGREFITSDGPVAKFNIWTQQSVDRRPPGFGSAGLIIAMPLSPRTAIVFYDEEVYSVPSKKHGHTVEVTAADVDGLNILQLVSATDHLFYSGTRPTAGQIDALPWQVRDRMLEFVEPKVYLRPDGRRLVETSGPPQPVCVRLSFFRVRRQKREVPLETRYRERRQGALRLVEDDSRSTSREILQVGRTSVRGVDQGALDWGALVPLARRTGL